MPVPRSVVPPADLSPGAVLRRQTRPYFRGLLARWSAAQEDPDRIRAVLARARAMKDEGELVQRHDGTELDLILETVAAHTRLLEDGELVAELLARHRTQRGLVVNVHHTPTTRTRIAEMCLAVLEENGPCERPRREARNGRISTSRASMALEAMMEEGWSLPAGMRQRLFAIVGRGPQPIRQSRFAADEDRRALAFHLLVACLDLTTPEVERLWSYLPGPDAFPADDLVAHPAAGPELWSRFIRETEQWAVENERTITEARTRPLAETRRAWSRPEVRSFLARYGSREHRKQLLAHQSQDERRETVAALFRENERKSLWELARGDLTPEGDPIRAEDMVRALRVVSPGTRAELFAVMPDLEPTASPSRTAGEAVSEADGRSR